MGSAGSELVPPHGIEYTSHPMHIDELVCSFKVAFCSESTSYTLLTESRHRSTHELVARAACFQAHHMHSFLRLKLGNQLHFHE